MNEDINPENALLKIDDYLTQIDDLLKKPYKIGQSELQELDTKIQGFIRAVFRDDNKKIKDYKASVHLSFSIGGIRPESEKQEAYAAQLQKIRHQLLSFKEEIELIISSKGKNELLNGIEKKTQKAAAEAERRKKIVESKALGAAIEMLDMLRNEIKRKDATSKDLIEIKGDISDLKKITGEIKNELSRRTQPEETQDTDIKIGSFYLGDRNAPVEIIEFGDFECPFCARFATTIFKEIKENYIDKGKVKFSFRHFPLSSIHPSAERFAKISECAKKQGKFWEFYSVFFEQYNSAEETSLDKILDENRIDTDNLRKCVSEIGTIFIQRDFSDGVKYGVNGTPTFFINGKKVVGAQPYSVFENAIESELNKNS